MRDQRVKLIVFTPETYADEVRVALGDAGAGRMGLYSHCTFSTKGVGRFIPQEGSDPHEGAVGKISAVDEERIETVCERAQVPEVIKAVKNVHPYEEVPIDIHPLLSEDDL